VVLQGFNSQLTMLDGRGGGAASGDTGDQSFGATSPAAAPRERKPAMAGGGRDDMDDEIPF
jgi:single-strand DNA-binding protein